MAAQRQLRDLALPGTIWQKPPPSASCGSSVVEHSLGKGEVESSILSRSTIPSPCLEQLSGFIDLFAACLVHRGGTHELENAWTLATYEDRRSITFDNARLPI